MKTGISILPFLAILIFGVAACSGPSEKEKTEERGPLTEEEFVQFKEEGQKIAMITFANLSGQLQRALAEGGVENAVQYCNLVAYPLVDSLSEVNEATIRRTSLKARNPKNAPDEAERLALQQYEAKAAAGEELQSYVELIDPSTVAFYAPILAQPLCLNCHGKIGETLKEEDYAVIKQLYPQDEATGYIAGDLRGMWSIRFKR
jgi:hypothetical protein